MFLYFHIFISLQLAKVQRLDSKLSLIAFVGLFKELVNSLRPVSKGSVVRPYKISLLSIICHIFTRVYIRDLSAHIHYFQQIEYVHRASDSVMNNQSLRLMFEVNICVASIRKKYFPSSSAFG